jgi:hypothetical protein
MGLLCAMRMTLGAVFLRAAVWKIQQPYEFLGIVYGYELFGRDTAVWVAFIIPWLEAAIGVTLLGNVCKLGSWACATLLSASFFVVRTWALYYGLEVRCGCLSVQDDSILDYGDVMQSAVMVVVSTLGLVSSIHTSHTAVAKCALIAGSKCTGR